MRNVCRLFLKIIFRNQLGSLKIVDKIINYNPFTTGAPFTTNRLPKSDTEDNSVMDISSNALSQPTSMNMDTDMNVYTTERASPAPVIGNIQSVLTTVNNSSTQAMASPTPPQLKMQHDTSSQMLTRPRLQELVREVDATEQLDEEVEEILLQLADDFVESTVNAACLLAKHRKANTIDIKDVQLHLERNWNMWLPGFGTDELRPYKRSTVTEAHKQRMALIRKALKKY